MFFSSFACCLFGRCLFICSFGAVSRFFVSSFRGSRPLRRPCKAPSISPVIASAVVSKPPPCHCEGRQARGNLNKRCCFPKSLSSLYSRHCERKILPARAGRSDETMNIGSDKTTTNKKPWRKPRLCLFAEDDYATQRRRELPRRESRPAAWRAAGPRKPAPATPWHPPKSRCCPRTRHRRPWRP